MGLKKRLLLTLTPTDSLRRTATPIKRWRQSIYANRARIGIVQDK